MTCQTNENKCPKMSNIIWTTEGSLYSDDAKNSIKECFTIKTSLQIFRQKTKVIDSPITEKQLIKEALQIQEKISLINI